jgi:hypothetical protein
MCGIKIRFTYVLCGYFGSRYPGYEAVEGVDYFGFIVAGFESKQLSRGEIIRCRDASEIGSCFPQRCA